MWRMRRLLIALPTALLSLALLAPLAVADPHDGAQGWVGEANDVIVTNAGFLLIAFFPLFILVMSLLQWQLDKRKYARKAAANVRADGDAWKGGW